MTWSSVAARMIGPAGKRRAGSAAELIWTLGFSGARMLTPRRPLTREPGSFARVLVVAPHPDDESIGCGGTLLRHRQHGAELVVVCATDGRTSRALGLGPDEMAARRKREAEACARVLGVLALDWLGLPGDAWSDDDLEHALHAALSRHRPEIVYAPSAIDFHPEHQRVARALARVWSDSATHPAAVRIYPVQVPLTARIANVVIDVTDCADALRAAMDAYVTQAANMERALRQRRYAAARHAAGRLAEEFWELSAEMYSRLHCEMKISGTFRGVRAHAISDPLAYLRGGTSRRRLAQFAAAARGSA